MRIVSALLTAAGMVAVPVILLLFRGRDPESGNEALIVYGVVGIALLAGLLYVYLAPERREVVATVLVIASALNTLAIVGVFILFLLGGSCNEGDNGHVPAVSWVGAIVVYLGLATWVLQRPWRPLWGVPLSVLAGGAWMVATAVALTGSTGACLS